MQLPRRISLALTPTPLERLDRLSEAWGGPTIWVKRDDLTGFELSGNKVRKLEFHLAAALDAGSDVVITAGAIQSNHCRATALASARLGLDCVLVLRTPDGEPPETATGNHRLQRLAGAAIEYVTPQEYRRRDEIMAEIADEQRRRGRRPWVIPEGASDALGMWGMATAFLELHDQMVRIPRPPAIVWHASSSAGTTAGLGWAADRVGSDVALGAVSIGDPIDQLRGNVERIWLEAMARHGGAMPGPDIRWIGTYIGGGYGIIDPRQPGVVEDAVSKTGLLFDPTYTGKALFALHEEIKAGRFQPEDHVVFWHTGGGFAALS
jgi:D-cysteine desulfhydrase